MYDIHESVNMKICIMALGSTVLRLSVYIIQCYHCYRYSAVHYINKMEIFVFVKRVHFFYYLLICDRQMEERLDAGYYTNLSMFEGDFKLMMDNCKLYNGPESGRYFLCKKKNIRLLDYHGLTPV